ncbi:hypothetical protein IWX50DRAFT_47715 [Phyllosticta citricarpa]
MDAVVGWLFGYTICLSIVLHLFCLTCYFFIHSFHLFHFFLFSGTTQHKHSSIHARRAACGVATDTLRQTDRQTGRMDRWQKTTSKPTVPEQHCSRLHRPTTTTTTSLHLLSCTRSRAVSFFPRCCLPAVPNMYPCARCVMDSHPITYISTWAQSHARLVLSYLLGTVCPHCPPLSFSFFSCRRACVRACVRVCQTFPSRGCYCCCCCC